MAGVGDVFYVPAGGIIAAVFLHAADAGAAGEHFGDGFHFNIAQTTRIQEGCPALVGSEQLFKWSWSKTGQHGGRLSVSRLQTGKRGGISAMLQNGAGDHNRRWVHGFEHFHPVPLALRELICANGGQDSVDTFTGHHGERF